MSGEDCALHIVGNEEPLKVSRQCKDVIAFLRKVALDWGNVE